jgi:ribose transport system substrate-binding protein
MKQSRVLAAGLIATGLVLAACGSSNKNSGAAATGSNSAPTAAPTGPSAGGNDAVATAKALVAKYSQGVTGVGVAAPASKKPDMGKKIVFLQCAVPTCKVFGDGVEDAANQLGWKVTRITYQLTPEGIQSAFGQAVQLKPDAIMSSGAPPQVTVEQRKAMKDAGIPFFDNSAVYESNPRTATGSVGQDPYPPTVLLEPASYVAFQGGELPANWAIAQTGGKVHSIFVNVPDFPIIVPPEVRYGEVLKQGCPKTCSNVVVGATVDQIGTTLPGKVVSALQQHPETNYIVFTSGDFSVGVSSAVQAAGFNNVKIIGETPVQANLDGLRSGRGLDEAWIGTSNTVIGWRLVDSAVRYFNGDKIASPVATGPDDTSAAAWPVPAILTKGNAPQSANFVQPDSYRQLFANLWHLG